MVQGGVAQREPEDHGRIFRELAQIAGGGLQGGPLLRRELPLLHAEEPPVADDHGNGEGDVPDAVLALEDHGRGHGGQGAGHEGVEETLGRARGAERRPSLARDDLGAATAATYTLDPVNAALPVNLRLTLSGGTGSPL